MEEFGSSVATPKMSYLLIMQCGEGKKPFEEDGLREPWFSPSPEDSCC